MDLLPDVTPIDANMIRQIAQANGLALSPERAEALLPAVRELLAVDAKIAALHLAQLPATGLTWQPGVTDEW